MSFRSFCAFSSEETTAKRVAFVRFRKLLAVKLATGTLVDATAIASASEDDGNGR